MTAPAIPGRRPKRGRESGIAWAEAAFLGLLRGLTEFLPVSSSAHLRIVGMGWLILVRTQPIAVPGLLFKDAIETSLRNLHITAAMLTGFAWSIASRSAWSCWRCCASVCSARCERLNTALPLRVPRWKSPSSSR
jgi:hypothetical protein